MAAVALIAASCSNDGDDVTNEPVELHLTSGVEVQQTRSNTQAEQIASEEKIYAWVDDAATSSSATEYINAWNLTADGSGNLTGSSRYFPESGNSVDIYALHGNFILSTFTEDETVFPASALTIAVEADQAPSADGSMAKYIQSDLLYAIQKGVSRNGASNNVKNQELTFYHLLSKVEVALKAGTGFPDLSDAMVTIENTRLKAAFTPNKTATMANQSERAAMVAATGANIAPGSIAIGNAASNDFGDGVVYNEAIIVPQKLSAGVQFIKVQLKNSQAALYYRIPETTFESGKKYIYNITVNLTGLTVTTEIKDWEPVTPISGTAEME